MAMAVSREILLLLSGATVFTVSVLAFRMLLGRRLRVLHRMQRLVIEPAQGLVVSAPHLVAATSDAALPGAAEPAARPRHSVVARRLAQMQRNLNDAGVLLRAQEYVAFTILSALVMALLLMVMLRHPLAAPLGGAVGLYLPKLYVGMVRKRRDRQISDQVPDLLIMLSSALKAGYGFLQAADAVAQEMPPPMRDEFRKLVRETHLGVTVDQSLRNLAERLRNRDLDLVIQAVLIQRQVGGNLAEVLDNIHHAVRERIRIKGEISTLTSQQRLSAIIVGALPVGMLLIISTLNPGYMNIMFEDPIGWAMVGVAVVMQIMGVMFIRRIIAIEV